MAKGFSRGTLMLTGTEMPLELNREDHRRQSILGLR